MIITITVDNTSKDPANRIMAATPVPDLKTAEIAALEIYSTHYEASCHERFDGGIHFYYGRQQKPDTTVFFFEIKEGG